MGRNVLYWRQYLKKWAAQGLSVFRYSVYTMEIKTFGARRKCENNTVVFRIPGGFLSVKNSRFNNNCGPTNLDTEGYRVNLQGLRQCSTFGTLVYDLVAVNLDTLW